MSAAGSACCDGLDVVRMLVSPRAKRSQRLSQGSPESREGIFDLRRDLPEIDSIGDPVRLQFLELLNQHFVADAADRASQFAIAAGPAGEVKQDQRLPFAGKHEQGGVQTAFEGTLPHLDPILNQVLTKRCILV